MPDPILPPAIDTLTLARVQSTYSGRPGCCCGCRGEHRTTQAARARMLAWLKKYPASWTFETGLPGDGGHFYHQTDTRLNILYLTPPESAQLS